MQYMYWTRIDEKKVQKLKTMAFLILQSPFLEFIEHWKIPF